MKGCTGRVETPQRNNTDSRAVSKPDIRPAGSSFTSSVLGLKAPDVPIFRIRVRVVSLGGKDAKGHKFLIHFQSLSTEADAQD
jgi:hypothetical protein